MSISDEAFRDAYKPLYIPAHYSAADSDENKVVYALARLGEASAEEVAKELLMTDIAIDESRFTIIAISLLNELFEKGLISGEEKMGKMRYNLQKITQANDGAVDPNLLAPGLD